MKPSGGITFSAVIVFIGCAFILLCGVFAVIGLAFAPAPETQLPFLRFAGLFGAVVMLSLTGWGIASGVGLLRLREWARISMLVFSALLLLMCIPGCLLFIFMPFPVPPNADDPEMMHHMMTVIRIASAAVYGSVGLLGGWWIYFFSRRSVKDQFRQAATSELTMGDVATNFSPRRPVSITVIAWFMLLGACLAPLMMPFYKYVLPGQQMPIFYFGYLLSGWSGITIFICLMAVQAAAAVGLLKLRLWGRTLAIWLQVLNLFNLAISFGIPANRAKFQQLMAAMESPYLQANGAFTFPVWIGAIVSLPIVAVLLWILVTQKQAFLNNGQPPQSVSQS